MSAPTIQPAAAGDDSDARLIEQQHQLEPVELEDAFAHLAIDHPDRCSGDPNWQPGGAR